MLIMWCSEQLFGDNWVRRRQTCAGSPLRSAGRKRSPRHSLLAALLKIVKEIKRSSSGSIWLVNMTGTKQMLAQTQICRSRDLQTSVLVKDSTHWSWRRGEGGGSCLPTLPGWLSMNFGVLFFFYIYNFAFMSQWLIFISCFHYSACSVTDALMTVAPSVAWSWTL